MSIVILMLCWSHVNRYMEKSSEREASANGDFLDLLGGQILPSFL